MMNGLESDKGSDDMKKKNTIEEAINKYKLKDGITMGEIIKELEERKIPHCEGGGYIHKNAYYSFWIALVHDIEVCVALPEDLSEWNDEDYVLVLDDSFGQPYTPFYGNKAFPFVLNVIGLYNKFMDSLNFLERR